MQENDLYKNLGIPKGASKKDIKNAYRKAAKKYHPDMDGGSEKKFYLIRRSFEILSDDNLREKYDTTGEAADNDPYNGKSTLVNIIAFAFNTVLAKCAETGESPLETDIVYRVKEVIKNSIAETEKQIRITKGILEIDLKLSGRFSLDKENIFENIVLFRISQLQISLSKFEESVKNYKEAANIIKECKFRSDKKPYQSPGDLMMERMGAFGGGYY